MVRILERERERRQFKLTQECVFEVRLTQENLCRSTSVCVCVSHTLYPLFTLTGLRRWADKVKLNEKEKKRRGGGL